MPRLRISPDDRVNTAIEDLITLAANARGLNVERSAGDRVNITVGKEKWSCKVIARNSVSQRDAEYLVATEARGHKIVVANQLSEAAKQVFEHESRASRNYRWSWLDRRGAIQFNHPRISEVILGDIVLNRQPTVPGGWRIASPNSDGPIRGRAGISFAAALLLEPARMPSIREVATLAEMSHGAVGDAAKLLRQSGLIRPGGEPETPDLFWALAAVWGSTRITPIGAVPSRDQARRLRAHESDLAQPGWALGGDAAAAAWGAPLFAAGNRPWIWVPTDADARRVERALISASWNDYSAVVTVPPTLLVCRNRLRPKTTVDPEFLPTAHPLFLALELAQDPARGHEILDRWTPDHPEFHRVW